MNEALEGESLNTNLWARLLKSLFLAISSCRDPLVACKYTLANSRSFLLFQRNLGIYPQKFGKQWPPHHSCLSITEWKTCQSNSSSWIRWLVCKKTCSVFVRKICRQKLEFLAFGSTFLGLVCRVTWQTFWKQFLAKIKPR